MLVLSRKLSEKIVIGEGKNQVVITVVEVNGNQIRLGFEAGRHVPIMRAELVAGTRFMAEAKAGAT